MMLKLMKSLHCRFNFVGKAGDSSYAFLMFLFLSVWTPVCIDNIFNQIEFQRLCHKLNSVLKFFHPGLTHFLLLFGQLKRNKAFPSIFDILLDSYDLSEEDKLWEGSQSLFWAGLFWKRVYDFCFFWVPLS